MPTSKLLCLEHSLPDSLFDATFGVKCILSYQIASNMQYMYGGIYIKIENWSICAYNTQKWHLVERHACNRGISVDIQLKMLGA